MDWSRLHYTTEQFWNGRNGYFWLVETRYKLIGKGRAVAKLPTRDSLQREISTSMLESVRLTYNARVSRSMRESHAQCVRLGRSAFISLVHKKTRI